MNRHALVIFLSVVFAIFTVTAHGRIIEVEAPASSVTVYPDRAAVTRTTTAVIPGGVHTLRITGLPADLDGDTLTVAGKADGVLRIGVVRLDTAFAEGPVVKQERQLRDELQALEDERQGLRDSISGYELQLEFIKSLLQPGEKRGENAPRERLDPTAWKTAWTTIGSGAAQTYAAMRQVQIKERSLTQRIQQKNDELKKIQTGRRATIAANVSIEAKGELTGRFTLSYQVRGASWRPVYDARLDSTSGTLTFTRAAEVRQRTGEAWEDIALTLSTARPARGTGVQPLQPWFIDFIKPVRPRTTSRSAAVPSMALDAAPAPSARLETLAPAEPVLAQTVATPYSAEYRVVGRVALPADDSPNRFPLTVDNLDVDLVVRAIPKQTPTGYLYALAVHRGEDPLLPGPVALYRDGMFAGTTPLPLVRPDEPLELAFGVDDKVAIEYRLLTDRRDESGLVQKTANHERRYRVNVVNHHRQPLKLTLMDQIPVAKDERIKVSLTKDSTPPDERDADDRTGVLTWHVALAGGQGASFDFGYVVSHPSDQTVPGF